MTCHTHVCCVVCGVCLVCVWCVYVHIVCVCVACVRACCVLVCVCVGVFACGGPQLQSGSVSGLDVQLQSESSQEGVRSSST